jgi:hypothetical protein
MLCPAPAAAPYALRQKFFVQSVRVSSKTKMAEARRPPPFLFSIFVVLFSRDKTLQPVGATEK